VVLAAVRQSVLALRYASETLKNDPIFVLSMKMIDIRRRFRWPRLVKDVLRFNREDVVFFAAFHPSVVAPQVDETFLDGGDEVGPQPAPFWSGIMNKRRKIA
jgi:hypothetical protein